MKEFKFKIDGKTYSVTIDEVSKDVANVEVNGKKITVNIEKKEKPAFVATPRPAAPSAAPVASAPAGKTVAGSITSPLPGSIVKIMVSVGQAVKRGDTLLTMESMKMENNIKADKDGIVKAIHVQPAQSVMQGDLLLDMESVGEAEPAPAPKATPKAAEAPAPKAPAGASTVTSPLPGSIVKILVKAGASVKRGDVVLTMESMKMENNIMAERDGVVKSIYVEPGKSVMQGDPLFDLE